MTDSAQSTDACPTCGQAVEVVTNDEGTSHYVGIDAWDASTLRAERDAAILSATMDLRGTLREIENVLEEGSTVPLPRLRAWNLARSALDQSHRGVSSS